MKDFYLEEISLNEFNLACERLGIPPYNPQIRKGKDKRYFKIDNAIKTWNIVNFLFSEDDRQLRSVIYPANEYEHKRKVVRSRNTSENYCLDILNRGDFNRISLEISRNLHLKSRHSDEFEFCRKAGRFQNLRRWVLVYFHIREGNFDIYNFKGIEREINKDETHSISGIYV